MSKSAVARPEERKFLGFRITNDGRQRQIAPQALARFKMRIRELTRRTLGLSLPQLVEQLPGTERPRRAVVGADDRVAVHGRGAGRRRRVPSDRALGEVGLASELTSRGASTTDVMLAGNWKTSRMVAHYSAGATAERGAVARYL